MPDYFSWRYRWLEFFVDGRRAKLLADGVGPEAREQERQQRRTWIAREYGERDVEEKFARWLGLEPPSLCIPGEYLELLHEVEDAYVRGASYPAWIGACCLAERILNDLILGVRSEFIGSPPRYKEVAGKESFDNWERVISILREWGIVDHGLATHFGELLKLRHIGGVHYGDVRERAERAKKAIAELYAIVSRRFGINTAPYLVCHGEIYVKKSFESDPFVKAFILPNCRRLSYVHRVQGQFPELEIVDDFPAEIGELTDEEFCEYRRAWRDEGIDGGKGKGVG
jgi:hypothetical protein